MLLEAPESPDDLLELDLLVGLLVEDVELSDDALDPADAAELDTKSSFCPADCEGDEEESEAALVGVGDGVGDLVDTTELAVAVEDGEGVALEEAEADGDVALDAVLDELLSPLPVLSVSSSASYLVEVKTSSLEQSPGLVSHTK